MSAEAIIGCPQSTARNRHRLWPPGDLPRETDHAQGRRRASEMHELVVFWKILCQFRDLAHLRNLRLALRGKHH
jgi:hypothetical protein